MTPKSSASVSESSCHSALIPVLLILTLWCPAAGAAEGRTKIGVLSVDTVLEHLTSWKDVQERLAALTKTAEARLAAMKKEIDRIRAELDYFKPDSRDYQARAAQLAEKQKEYARVSDELRQNIARRACEADVAVREQIAKAARDYAVANGLDVVVDSRAVFYVAGGADISLKVALAMNKGYKDMAPKKSTEESKEQ